MSRPKRECTLAAVDRFRRTRQRGDAESVGIHRRRGSLVAAFTLEMTKRTGGAFEPGSAVTAPAKLKTLAGRIAQQDKQFSPDRLPTPEFRK